MIATLLKINILKTIRLNFKLLPFVQAVKLPIILLGRMDIDKCKGKIILTGPIKTGIVRVGCYHSLLYGNRGSLVKRFSIYGSLFMQCDNPFYINNGAKIVVKEGGKLSIGGDCHFNAESVVVCTKEITFGNRVRVSWQCQVFDTNFHQLSVNGCLSNIEKPVRIGSDVWIGNRVTINAGAVIPNRCVVASNSLVNKDLSQFGETSLFGGIPAKFIKNGVERVF